MRGEQTAWEVPGTGALSAQKGAPDTSLAAELQRAVGGGGRSRAVPASGGPAPRSPCRGACAGPGGLGPP